MKKYTGSCHCGEVKFTIEGEFTEGMSCNCSHCKRKGFLLAFVPASQFNLLSGADNITTYQFNKKHVNHEFCKTCGVQCFGRSGETVALNLNCLDDFDTDSLTIKKVDGKNF